MVSSFYHISCLGLNDSHYINDDERKSMAIVNMQAILNTDDVDHIIQLLE